MNIWGYSREFKESRIVYGGGRRRSSFSGAIRFYWLIFAVTLILDMLSKWIVIQTMVLHQSIPLVGTILKLTYVRNTGAAFSLLAYYNTPWRTALFVGVAVIAIVVLTIIAYREKNRGKMFMLPLGLVCGGALGNLLDRLISGTVVDFIDFSYRDFHWPVFNLADSAVVIGVFWLFFITFRNQPKRSKLAK